MQNRKKIASNKLTTRKTPPFWKSGFTESELNIRLKIKSKLGQLKIEY